MPHLWRTCSGVSTFISSASRLQAKRISRFTSRKFAAVISSKSALSSGRSSRKCRSQGGMSWFASSSSSSSSSLSLSSSLSSFFLRGGRSSTCCRHHFSSRPSVAEPTVVSGIGSSFSSEALEDELPRLSSIVSTVPNMRATRSSTSKVTWSWLISFTMAARATKGGGTLASVGRSARTGRGGISRSSMVGFFFCRRSTFAQ
ncbi:hypothetical protein TYRP_009028 [Tyrophagus putrescentiae]|nr:hypothetical protein TYRP_009028 [Tyrophagus putrescentiae]